LDALRSSRTCANRHDEDHDGFGVSVERSKVLCDRLCRLLRILPSDSARDITRSARIGLETAAETYAFD
jgi:hypothetical protein